MALRSDGIGTRKRRAVVDSQVGGSPAANAPIPVGVDFVDTPLITAIDIIPETKIPTAHAAGKEALVKRLETVENPNEIDTSATNPAIGSLMDMVEKLDQEFIDKAKLSGEFQAIFSNPSVFEKYRSRIPILINSLNSVGSPVERENLIKTIVRGVAQENGKGPTHPIKNRVDFNPNTDHTLDGKFWGNKSLEFPDLFNFTTERFLPGRPSDITFPIFRSNIWQRKTGVDGKRNVAAGGIQDAELSRGKYVFQYKLAHSNAAMIATPRPFSVHGKNQTLIKATSDPTTGRITIMVEVRENFVLLLSLGIAALVAGGWAIGNAKESIEAVDKVIIDSTKGSTKLAIAALIGVVAFTVVPKLGSKFL